MASLFPERSRLGPPTLELSGLARHPGTNTTHRLSRPQKRRMRLQRQAVREAARHCKGLVSAAPFLNSTLAHQTDIDVSQTDAKMYCRTAMCGFDDEVLTRLTRIESLIADLHVSCLGYPATDARAGVAPTGQIPCPERCTERLRADAPAFEPHEIVREESVARYNDVSDEANAWEPLPFLSVADVSRLRADSKRHVSLVDGQFSSSISMANLEKVEVEAHGSIDKLLHSSCSELPFEKHNGFAQDVMPARNDGIRIEHADAIADRVKPSEKTRVRCLERLAPGMEPLRPPSAWFLFAADYREEHAHHSSSEICARINAAWTCLDLRTKRAYEDLHSELECDYKQKLRRYMDQFR
eukprot:TRINITY_DN17382_c0_g1_i2.p1 TRINITY_DN17382_c0_g1~~TRINITY_DN17382_c0_g1_i2.p1  ORF type:complete len:363 (-),score=35.53 TRINITY_DN17382_c0_g1_i2:102-1166(-)